MGSRQTAVSACATCLGLRPGFGRSKEGRSRRIVSEEGKPE
jgi:hypothetical protein